MKRKRKRKAPMTHSERMEAEWKKSNIMISVALVVQIIALIFSVIALLMS